jgi:general secretion pathway protein M
MIDAIHQWWRDLSLREQWLVGSATALTTACLAWLLIYAPLRSALSSAKEANAIAIDRQAAIAARVATIKQLEQRGQQPGRTSPSTAEITLALSQSANERGITLSRNDPVGNSGATVAIAAARAPILSVWLAGLEADGYSLSDVSIRSNADGTVAMTATIGRTS